MLRRHQREFRDLLEEIRAGRRAGRSIFMEVTPGGGKSVIAVIAAAIGIPRIGDAVCVVTPRENLQTQMEDSFVDPLFRRELGHVLRARLSTNQEDPSRGLAGYITTYQALVADRRGVNRLEFERRRYILVLDEIHHIAEDGEFHRAVRPLVERAALVVFMTGTLERADGKRIAYVPYRTTIEGKTAVDLDPFIRYLRADALGEKAVIPLVFQHLDGDASWIDREGQMVAPLPLSMAGKHQTPDAIFTVLRTDYARHLLDRCVRDWLAYRQRRPRSKLLVVAPNIKLAKKYLAWLKTMGIARVEIATSEDTGEARKVIEEFRTGDLEAIVTVAMAYEGLDCKSITHIACLTHIRSRAWVEQLISRANRVDPGAGPWETQRGFIYAPDDYLIVEVFEKIRIEQEPFIRDADERAADAEDGEGELTDRAWVVPIDGRATRVRAGSLDGETLDYAETAAILGVLQELGYEGVMSPTDMLTAHRKLQALALSGPPATEDDLTPEPRPSTEEGKLRESIEAHCRGWDSENDQQFGSMNRMVYQRFGKSRENMSSEELRAVWAWLNREHPRRRSA